MQAENAAGRRDDPPTPEIRLCPECGTEYPVLPGYVTWCDRCGWNLKPPAPPRNRNIVDSLYSDLGSRLGKGLYDDLIRTPTLRPSLTPSLFLAIWSAMAVHLFTLLSALLGLYLLLFHLHNPIAVFFGLLCLLIFVFLAPRPSPYPKKVIDHGRRPALYQAVDEVAEALGAPPPDAILLSADFNASYRRAGWRRRHVLTLGLPLLTILDEQETAALIAHELAHAVNGDATRGFLIGSAAATLARWFYLLIPDRFSGMNRRRYGLGGMIANGLMFGTAQVVRFAAAIMSHLVWHDLQRAEYLADHLAAEVAGTTATVALLEKVHMGGMFQDVVRRATLQPEGANLFADLRESMASLPERERERLRRVARLEGTRLDSTHPPTGFRVALLEARPFAQPRMVLSALQWRAVHQELAAAEPGMQRRLIDHYRAGLYR